MRRPLWMALALVIPALSGRAEEPKAPVVSAPLKIERNVFANGVTFDAEGRCIAENGRELKSWRVPGFPAQIPPFESCTTLLGKPADPEVEFVLSIVDSKHKTLQKVDGVLTFGSNNRGSQAINWDHLEIPAAGTYHMVVKVNGKEIGRASLKFVRAGKAGKR